MYAGYATTTSAPGNAQATRRAFWKVVGFTSLVAGIIGIFVPIWPTTCFLLLAVTSFSRSSDRMHRWMLTNRYFGRQLALYRNTGTVHPCVKITSLVLLWGSLAVSVALVGTGKPWLVFTLLAVGTAVTVHVARLRSQLSM